MSFDRRRVTAVLALLLLAIAINGFSIQSIRAQNNVGVNTANPAPSAILDLTSTTQGFLVPRMTTANYNPGIVSPATGLLVYDNAKNVFYYYNSAAWVPFLSISGNAAGWLTTGNAGTSAATNFVGTTDAQDFVMRTNNVEGMRLTSSGYLAVGTTTASQKLEDAGNMRVDPVGGVASQLQFMNPAGTFSTTFAAGAQAAIIPYTWPTAQGAGSTMLTNNGSGTLSWATLSNTTGWLLTGNAGTLPGTNFIGTTDAKDFVINTNGNEGFRLTSAGLVGMGITTPTQSLDVSGNVKLDSAGGAASQVIFSNPTGTFTTTIKAGAEAANINYTLPLTQGAANTILSNSGTGVLNWVARSTLNWSLLGNAGTVAGTNFEGTKGLVDMVWKTNNTEGMRLSSTQNLGIGTNLPTSKLHTVASGAKVGNYTGNLLTNTATSSTASVTKYGVDIQSTGTWNGATAINTGMDVNVSGGATNYSGIFQGGNVGDNTASPATYLDDASDVSMRYSNYTASNGNNNDIAIGTSSFLRITGPSAAFEITGVAGGVDGKYLVLYNSTSQPITIGNENANSTAANRIWTLNSTGDLVFNSKCAIKMIYSTADSRWIVLSSSTTVSTTTNGVIIKKKPVDQSIASSTTLTNDNDLAIPIVANDSMVIDGYLHTNTTSNTPMLQLAWTIPAGATMDFNAWCDETQNDNEVFTFTSSGTAHTLQMPIGDICIHFWGVVITGGTAGTIQLQWAQATSNATPMTLKNKSFMKAYYIR
jgi:hypothetical protein